MPPPPPPSVLLERSRSESPLITPEIVRLPVVLVFSPLVAPIVLVKVPGV